MLAAGLNSRQPLHNLKVDSFLVTIDEEISIFIPLQLLLIM